MTLEFLAKLFVPNYERIKQMRKRLDEVLPFLTYSATNEVLEAIVNGLDLKPEDNVLAIAGSGDQAFAMLEYGCKVTAIDIKLDQIKFVKLRAEALKLKCYEDFLRKKANPERIKAYFAKEGRLDRIRANLDNLKVLEPSNIFTMQSAELFSKIYLSNALAGSHVHISEKDSLVMLRSYKELLSDVTKNLTLGGLVYETSRYNHHEMSLGLMEEAHLSLSAQDYERANSYGWHPMIFRKVAEVEK